MLWRVLRGLIYQRHTTMSYESGFSVHRYNPIARLAYTLWKGNTIISFFVILLLFFVPSVVLAAISGSLTGNFDVQSDLSELFLFRQNQQQHLLLLPLLRDYCIIAITLLMSFYIAHVISQWETLSVIPTRLADDGMVRLSTESLDAWQKLQAEYDKRFNTLWLEAAAALAAISVVVGVSITIMANGIYSTLDRTVPTNNHMHYKLWWANFEQHRISFVCLMLTIALFLYMLFRDTLVGVIYILMICSLYELSLKASPDRGVWLRFASPWQPANDALQWVRKGFRDIISSVVIGMSVLALGAFYISFSSLVVVTLLIVYIVYCPLLVLIPAISMNTMVRNSASQWHHNQLNQLRLVVMSLDEAVKREELALLNLEERRREYEQSLNLQPQATSRFPGEQRAEGRRVQELQERLHDQLQAAERDVLIATRRVSRWRGEVEVARQGYDVSTHLPTGVLAWWPVVRGLVLYCVPVLALFISILSRR